MTAGPDEMAAAIADAEARSVSDATPRQIVLATHNRHKVDEFQAIVADVRPDLQVISYDGPEPVEDGVTFAENALIKARAAAVHTGLPALADDSGICVDALGGAPGVRSARYAGEPSSDARNNDALIAALRGVADRRAHYYCVLVLVRHPADPQPLIAEGAWHGRVVDTPRGHGGFGYDPHFEDLATGLTGAELPLARKNELSHRGRAMRSLIARIGDERLHAR
jgi:XTP/dITP diphosphohydrolase